jgi:hypothetical protein
MLDTTILCYFMLGGVRNKQSSVPQENVLIYAVTGHHSPPAGVEVKKTRCMHSLLHASPWLNA